MTWEYTKLKNPEIMQKRPHYAISRLKDIYIYIYDAGRKGGGDFEAYFSLPKWHPPTPKCQIPQEQPRTDLTMLVCLFGLLYNHFWWFWFFPSFWCNIAALEIWYMLFQKPQKSQKLQKRSKLYKNGRNFIIMLHIVWRTKRSKKLK